jgi:hypothetical protein
MSERAEERDREESLDELYRRIADNREHPERRRPRPERVPGDPGYEIRGRRKTKDGRASIEAWLPGWHWPVVRAVEEAGRWLVLADPKIAELGGLGRIHLAAGEVVTARERHAMGECPCCALCEGSGDMSGLSDGWWVKAEGVYVIVGLPLNTLDSAAELNDRDALALAERLIAASESAARVRRSVEGDRR